MYRHLGDTGVIMYSLLNTCSAIVLISFTPSSEDGGQK